MDRLFDTKNGAATRPATASTDHGAGRSAASNASGGIRCAMCARHIAGSYTRTAKTSTIQSTRPATTTSNERLAGFPARRRITKRTTNAAPASTSASTTSRSRSHSVSKIFDIAPVWVFARCESWWYTYDWSHTRPMPNGSALTM